MILEWLKTAEAAAGAPVDLTWRCAAGSPLWVEAVWCTLPHHGMNSPRYCSRGVAAPEEMRQSHVPLEQLLLAQLLRNIREWRKASGGTE